MRKRADQSGTSATVTFTGELRGRSWNGVQTTPAIGPVTNYRLTYTIDQSGTIELTVGLTPTVDLPRTSAFYALTVPLHGFEGWELNGVTGRAGERIGDRVGECKSQSHSELIITLAGSCLAVTAGDGFQNAFIVEGHNGTASLFLALLDGTETDLKAHEELSATATITTANSQSAIPSRFRNGRSSYCATLSVSLANALGGREGDEEEDEET